MKAILDFFKNAEQSHALAVLELLFDHNNQLNKINMKITDLAATLTNIDTQVTTIAASVAALQTSLTNVDLPADAKAALDKLTTDVSALSTEVTPAAPAA